MIELKCHIIVFYYCYRSTAKICKSFVIQTVDSTQLSSCTATLDISDPPLGHVNRSCTADVSSIQQQTQAVVN